ncbi:MAG: hypothetical protein WCZ66_00470 [Sphingomonadaceae bacterium]
MKWIEANHLEQWGRTNASEAQLPELVADLICATTGGISSIRFPSRGKGRTRGFDGVLECLEESVYVPNGKSVWELKSSAKYKAAAQADFFKRTEQTDPEDQKQTTLILVTPFTWDSSDRKKTREGWIAEKKSEAHWKNVAIIDGSMLEHWLHMAPAVAARWAREPTIRGFSVHGVQSTDEYWQHFSGRFNPRIIEDLLTTEREAMVEKLLKVLMGPPQQITIMGDAPEFATAFAVAAIRSANADIRQYIESRTLIVDTIEAGRALVGQKNLAFLLRNEAAQSPVSFAEDGPTVVPVARRNPANNGIPLIRQTAFAIKQVLIKMNVAEGEAETLSRGCGGSLSALQRMRPSGACDLPPWEEKKETLLPAVLAGAWDRSNSLDKEIVAALAGTPTYSAYESQIRSFLKKEDAPLLLEENIFKVTAPIDAFVHVGTLIGDDNLQNLKAVLTSVFSKLDPEPDPNDLYRAHGANRHSEWLRDGLATTLLLIAAWQKEASLSLATGRGQAFANEVIGELPGLGADHRVLTSLENELPLLAEAAPGPFLWALERMLEGSGAAIRPIFDEVDGLAFPISKHAGVLWALETLAWDPEWFRRVCLVLAGLAAIDPGGRTANRPIASLTDIFLSWMPCTYVSSDERFAVLDEIITDYPEVGWELILRLLPGQTTSSSGTHRPRVRGADFPSQPALTRGDVWEAERAVSNRAVALANGDASKMQQLLRPMLDFAEPERNTALEALNRTLASVQTSERTTLWQALQKQIARHKRFASAKWALDAKTLAEFEAIADAYEPNDPVLLAAELFTFWDDESEAEKIQQDRVAAVTNLADRSGPDAVRALLRRAQQPHLVLGSIAAAKFDPSLLEAMLRGEFEENPDDLRAGNYFSMLGLAAGADAALNVAADLLRSGNAASIAKLMRVWPTEPATWTAAKSLGDEVYEHYWRDFESHRIDGNRRDLLSVVIQLMRRGRSLVALESSVDRIKEVPSCIVLRMLDEIVGELNAGQKPRVGGLLGYALERTFNSLDQRNLSDIEIGKREYALLSLLDGERRPLKLHHLMVNDPEMFHQILRDVYRAESAVHTEKEETDESRAQWRQAYRLLSDLATVPGFTGDTPDRDALDTWVAAVRTLGEQNDRKDVTDIVVGNVLAHAPIDDIDQIWPHRFIRDLLEKESGKIPRGIVTERVNMRGVTVRGVFDGGDQERELAAKYRKDAGATQRWPKTSEMLRRIASRWDEYAKEWDIDAKQQRLRS